MAGQSIFFRTFSLINMSSKIFVTNRPNLPNFAPGFMGLKQDSNDAKKSQIPEKPKKPLTAFFTFMVEQRQILTKENPALSNQDIVKKISEEWKYLSDDARIKYEQQAKQNKVEYEKKIIDYQARLTPEQESILKEIEKEKLDVKKRKRMKQELKSEGKPKKPATSFGLFVRENSREKGMKEGKTASEVMSELKKLWENMTDAEKNKYKLAYNANKERYEKELKAWEAKMMTEGKEQLVRIKTLKEYPSIEKAKKSSKPE